MLKTPLREQSAYNYDICTQKRKEQLEIRGGGYSSRKVTACVYQWEKTVHPHILSRSPRPVFTDFWRTFFHKFTTIYSNCLMIICLFIAVFDNILMIIDSFDDSWQFWVHISEKIGMGRFTHPPQPKYISETPPQDRVNDFKVFFS